MIDSDSEDINTHKNNNIHQTKINKFFKEMDTLVQQKLKESVPDKSKMVVNLRGKSKQSPNIFLTDNGLSMLYFSSTEVIKTNLLTDTIICRQSLNTPASLPNGYSIFHLSDNEQTILMASHNSKGFVQELALLSLNSMVPSKLFPLRYFVGSDVTLLNNDHFGDFIYLAVLHVRRNQGEDLDLDNDYYYEIDILKSYWKAESDLRSEVVYSFNSKKSENIEIFGTHFLPVLSYGLGKNDDIVVLRKNGNHILDISILKNCSKTLKSNAKIPVKNSLNFEVFSVLSTSPFNQYILQVDFTLVIVIFSKFKIKKIHSILLEEQGRDIIHQIISLKKIKSKNSKFNKKTRNYHPNTPISIPQSETEEIETLNLDPPSIQISAHQKLQLQKIEENRLKNLSSYSIITTTQLEDYNYEIKYANPKVNKSLQYVIFSRNLTQDQPFTLFILKDNDKSSKSACKYSLAFVSLQKTQDSATPSPHKITKTMLVQNLRACKGEKPSIQPIYHRKKSRASHLYDYYFDKTTRLLSVTWVEVPYTRTRLKMYNRQIAYTPIPKNKHVYLITSKNSFPSGLCSLITCHVQGVGQFPLHYFFQKSTMKFTQMDAHYSKKYLESSFVMLHDSEIIVLRQRRYFIFQRLPSCECVRAIKVIFEPKNGLNLNKSSPPSSSYYQYIFHDLDNYYRIQVAKDVKKVFCQFMNYRGTLNNPVVELENFNSDHIYHPLSKSIYIVDGYLRIQKISLETGIRTKYRIGKEMRQKLLLANFEFKILDDDLLVVICSSKINLVVLVFDLTTEKIQLIKKFDLGITPIKLYFSREQSYAILDTGEYLDMQRGRQLKLNNFTQLERFLKDKKISANNTTVASISHVNSTIRKEGEEGKEAYFSIGARISYLFGIDDTWMQWLDYEVDYDYDGEIERGVLLGKLGLLGKWELIVAYLKKIEGYFDERSQEILEEIDFIEDSGHREQIIRVGRSIMESRDRKFDGYHFERS